MSWTRPEKVTIVTEYEDCTQDRFENVGSLILDMTDYAAGRWIKRAINFALDSAHTDERCPSHPSNRKEPS